MEHEKLVTNSCVSSPDTRRTLVYTIVSWNYGSWRMDNHGPWNSYNCFGPANIRKGLGETAVCGLSRGKLVFCVQRFKRNSPESFLGETICQTADENVFLLWNVCLAWMNSGMEYSRGSGMLQRSRDAMIYKSVHMIMVYEELCEPVWLKACNQLNDGFQQTSQLSSRISS